MENKNLKKMTITASIAAAVLVIVLIVSVIITVNRKLTLLQDTITIELGTVNELTLKPEDFFKIDDTSEVSFDVSKVDLTTVGDYKAYANFNGQKFTIKVIVTDTTAPVVTLKERYIFTNNIATLEDFSSMIEIIKEPSEYTTKLIRFEKEDVLCELNDLALENLVEKISLPGDASKLKILGSADIPTEQGIYRSVLEIADVHGNTSYEEIFVILDTTGALITEVEDLVYYVDAEDKLGEEPELDYSLYSAVDDVDGYLTSDDLTIELTLQDEDAHEWITNVSYTDRAGNESLGEFLITVKVDADNASNNGGGNNAGGGNSGNGGNTGNGGSNTGTGNGGGSTGGVTGYDPADTNRDGVVDGEEGCAYIDSDEQTCIDAGYGVIVSFDGGSRYMVFTPYGGYVNGVHGMEILSNYLSERGLTGSIGIHSSNEDYGHWYSATDIREIVTEEDEGFWQ